MKNMVVDTKQGGRGKTMRRQQGRRWQFGLAGLAGLLVWGSVAVPVSAQSEADLAAGKQLYDQRCAHCHGEEGDGQGSATEYVFPKPRDFTSGVYKFRTRHETEDGNRLASDDDIYRSICEGLHGSSMPGWCGFFTEPQVWQLVHYIKTFGEVFQEDKPGRPIDYSGEIPFSEESAAQGKEYFVEIFECHTCHGMAGRGNGQQALDGLEDDWGERIWPANLTQPWTYRGGHHRRDMFRNVVMGIAGTPMPAFADPDPLAAAREIEDAEERKEEEAAAQELRAQLWHVVNYVQSLWTHPEEPEPQAALTAVRVSGALPVGPDDAAWDEVPVYYYPVVGQVVEGDRLFTPMVVGVDVQALHNDAEIAFRLVWDDRTESKPGEGDEGETFADAIALQFPSKPLEGSQKPYFLMGDSSNPTDLWYWRNDTNQTVLVQTTGYKTFQPGEETGGIESQGVVDDGQYRVVMQRALTTKAADREVQFHVGAFIPFSLTVWDGSNGETGGDKRTVMAWYNVYLESEASKAPLYLLAVGIAVGLVIEFSALYVTKNGANSQAQSESASETGEG
jgi:DMSO reductase family type II enzyme heme b subunit